MEDLEQRIQQVLSDPAQMQQVLDMAQMLGVTLPVGTAAASDASQTHPDTAPDQGRDTPPSDQPPEALRTPVEALLQQAGRLDARQENLLNALKPFLKPSRREKIDRALQVARLSHLAQAALRGRGAENG